MINDEQLIRLLKNGENDALKHLIEKYKTPLYSFILHLCKDKHEAQDIFQDTWVKVLKNIGSYKESNFKNWVMSIALNLYRDRYRKKKRWINRITDYFKDTESKDEALNSAYEETSMDQDLIVNEEKLLVKKAVDRLEETYRIPVILFYFQEKSYSDISEILGIPTGTVKSRLNTAKKKLKSEMEAIGFER